MTTISDPAGPAADDLRNALVDTIVSNGLVQTPRIEQVMRTIPRHVFVPAASLGAAYANSTVDVKLDGDGKSISCASQPGVVGLMLEQLQPRRGHNILELEPAPGTTPRCSPASLARTATSPRSTSTTTPPSAPAPTSAPPGSRTSPSSPATAPSATQITPPTTASSPRSEHTASHRPGWTSSRPVAGCGSPATARQRVPLSRLRTARRRLAQRQQRDEHLHAAPAGHRPRPRCMISLTADGSVSCKPTVSRTPIRALSPASSASPGPCTHRACSSAAPSPPSGWKASGWPAHCQAASTRRRPTQEAIDRDQVIKPYRSSAATFERRRTHLPVLAPDQRARP